MSSRLAIIRARLHRFMPDWLVYPLFAFTITRLVIFGVGLFGDAMLPTEPGHWVADPASPFLSMWAKWDSQWYVQIAREGYWFRPQEQSNVAFFPLYPMLMRGLGTLFGGQVVLAGFVLSNLALFGTLIFLYRLTEIELLDVSAARRSVLYLAIFPTAFFFSSVYTESLFLMLGIGTMYFARRQLWFAAALMGMLAAATRNIGVILWGLVMWEWLRRQGWTVTRIHTREAWKRLWNGVQSNWIDILIIGLIPIGLLGYVLFLQRNFGVPLAFVETQAAWGRENIGPFNVILRDVRAIIAEPINKGWLSRFLNLTTFFGFLATVPFIWKRLGEGYALYVLINLLVPTSSASMSVIRYVLTLFPVFMLLGEWGRRDTVNRSLIIAFSVLLGLLVTIYVNWVFVA